MHFVCGSWQAHVITQSTKKSYAWQHNCNTQVMPHNHHRLPQHQEISWTSSAWSKNVLLRSQQWRVKKRQCLLGLHVSWWSWWLREALGRDCPCPANTGLWAEGKVTASQSTGQGGDGWSDSVWKQRDSRKVCLKCVLITKSCMCCTPSPGCWSHSLCSNVLSDCSLKALIYFKNILNGTWDSPVAWAVRKINKYNETQGTITHYSRIFEGEESHLRSFEWKDLRWEGLRIISFALFRLITEKEKHPGTDNVIIKKIKIIKKKKARIC